MIFRFTKSKPLPSFKIIILFLSLITHKHLIAQDKIDSALSQLSEQLPDENISLLVDKKYYVAGETIVFKAFVFSGYQLSNTSTNLSIDLLEQK